MQDDTTKRTTVEDQELADMIANLNGAAPVSAAPAPLPDPVAPSDPSPSLPPLPPLPTPDPVPAPAPVTEDPVPPTGSDFVMPTPTPGLPPLPSAGMPIEPIKEKFEEPMASTLPPLNQPPIPLPPLPNFNNQSDLQDEEDPDADINEIAASFPDSPAASSRPVPVSTDNSDLSAIKQDVLDELRPLVDKLDLPAQEKFDTLLLLIRSNDDKSLISQAYEAAEAIDNDTKRAAALLDIVKEIDYFQAA